MHRLRWVALGPRAMELVTAVGHPQAPSFHPHPNEPVPSSGPTFHITDSLGYGVPCQVPEQHWSPLTLPGDARCGRAGDSGLAAGLASFHSLAGPLLVFSLPLACDQSFPFGKLAIRVS